MIFPCVKVQEDYRDIEDVIRMCQVRIRVPEKWWGDYLALLGSARVGERQVHALADGDRLGPARRVRRGLARLQRGPHGGSDRTRCRRARSRSAATTTPSSTCRENIPVNVKVKIGDGRVVGRPTRQRRLPALRAQHDRGDGALGGDARCLQRDPRLRAAQRGQPSGGSTSQLRENCVVGIPRHPASCSVATCNLVDRVGNAVQRGIAELADGFGMAECGLSTPASVGVISGRDERHGGAPYIDQLVLGWTGGPACSMTDGWLTMGGIGDAGVLQRDSVEIDEMRFPLRIDAQRDRPRLGGAGTAARRPGGDASR